MKKIMLVLLLCCLCLCGCYDAKEVDDLAYGIALGIDCGQTAAFRVTLQYVVPLNLSGGIHAEDAKGAPLSTLTFETDSLHTVADIANAKIAKTTDLSHLRLLLIAEACAKQDIGYLREELRRLTDFRPDAGIAVCRGSAYERLRAVSSPLAQNPARFYENFFKNSASVYTLKQTTADFFGNKTAFALPLLAESEFLADGIAVLQNNKLHTVYPKECVLLYNLMQGDFTDLKYKTENGVFRLDSRAAPRFSVQTAETPVISVTLRLSGEPVSGKDFLFTDSNRATQELTQALEADILHFLQRTAADTCDIFGISRYAAMHFLTEADFAAYRFDARYAKAVFSVHVHFRNLKTA